MRFLRRSLVGIFLMALTLGLLAYAGSIVRDAVQERMNAEPRSFPQRERVITVNVTPYEGQSIVPEMTVFGELRSRQSVPVRTSVSGTITMVSDSFVDGGQVQAGDVLLSIDPIEAQEALARVQADVRDAEAGVRDAQRGLALAQDELSAAETQATLRQRAWQRQQDLQTRGIGTAPEREAAELAASSANQAVLSRRQGVASAEAQIDQAASSLSRMQINLAEAQRRLNDTTLTAAFDGTLTSVAVAAGGRVTANEQLAELIDPAALEVSFRVSTSQYAVLLTEGALAGAPVSVSLDASGVNLTAQGVITRESATVGEGQTGRLIFARLNAAPGFRPGDFVTVVITEPEMQRVALLPAAAVAADSTVLAVGEEDRLREVPVEVLRRQGDNVIVRSRELRGQMVVAARTPLLGAGIKVNPLVAGAPIEEEVEEMIVLAPERRDELIARIEGNAFIPADVKTRIITQLSADEVPASVIERIENGRGG